MSKLDLKLYGIETNNVHHNLSVDSLVQKALENNEGKLSANKALTINTGKYTGRSPNDKFIVDSLEIHDEIYWGDVNRPISQENFDNLYKKVVSYLKDKELFVFDGFAGANEKYRMSFRIINELPSQNLFIHQLLIRPTLEELNSFKEDFVFVVAPKFKCNPEIDHVNSKAAIIIDYVKKLVLIVGTKYSGEIKKSVFSVMNYFMPKKNVLPMHCSANVGNHHDSAIFFGLSGTGKTTLSTTPTRRLIGDDEHGWAEDSLFNFEGGCYAKCINLSLQHEPEIYNAIKYGAVVENVVMDELGNYDFNDASLTENTRVGYPLDYIENAKIPSMSRPPKTIIFLSADAYGVLPPISKLDANQAMYYFISGYTSKLAGTERGITTPQATFSACFGEPFLPLNPIVYANMLCEKIKKGNVNVFLVNTGWIGGSYGVGKRIKLKYTRAIVNAAIDGELNDVEYIKDDIFGLNIPTSCPNVPSEVLNQENKWENKEEYQKTAKHLAALFQENFKKYQDIGEEVIASGPRVK